MLENYQNLVWLGECPDVTFLLEQGKQPWGMRSKEAGTPRPGESGTKQKEACPCERPAAP
uniref:KRAB domain-containing protein n=1 Tax=Equus asinus TaxID=9793 RepID=A0A9L0IK68_EQUAS